METKDSLRIAAKLRRGCPTPTTNGGPMCARITEVALLLLLAELLYEALPSLCVVM